MNVQTIASKAEAIKAYSECVNNRAKACKFFGNNAFIKEAASADKLSELCDEYITTFNTCIANLQLLKEGAHDWEAQKEEKKITAILGGITDPELKAKYRAMLDAE